MWRRVVVHTRDDRGNEIPNRNGNPMGMAIKLQHRNGKGVWMNVDGNGNNWENSHEYFYCCKLALGCRPIRHNWRNIWNDECRNIFDWFSTYCKWYFRIFIFQRLMSSFLWNCFSVARLSTVCIYTSLCWLRPNQAWCCSSGVAQTKLKVEPGYVDPLPSTSSFLPPSLPIPSFP